MQGGTTLVLVTVSLTIAVILAWTWLSLMAARLMNEPSGSDRKG